MTHGWLSYLPLSALSFSASTSPKYALLSTGVKQQLLQAI
mgnify:CR=1 FL=1